MIIILLHTTHMRTHTHTHIQLKLTRSPPAVSVVWIAQICLSGTDPDTPAALCSYPCKNRYEISINATHQPDAVTSNLSMLASCVARSRSSGAGMRPKTVSSSASILHILNIYTCKYTCREHRPSMHKYMYMHIHVC